jgi:hypothetical protein
MSDWKCLKCNFIIFGKKSECLKCHSKRPKEILNSGAKTYSSNRFFPISTPNSSIINKYYNDTLDIQSQSVSTYPKFICNRCKNIEPICKNCWKYN